MVSFQCDGCADTVKKPQLDKHKQRCWSSFTCLDCSTTFQNQDYKNHTSCISEAEKYQGALYKGPKKAQATVPLPAAASTSASASPAPSAGVGAAIHPSRLNQLQSTSEPTYNAPIQSYPSRGGRFARGGARGGYGAPSRGGGGNTKYSATGENRNAPEGGMRSWGSNANSEAGGEGDAIPTTQASASSWGPVVTAVNGDSESVKKNTNKKKGDKKGTGSRANTRNPPKTSVNGDDPTSDSAPAPSQTPAPAPIPTPTLPTPDISEKASKKRKFESSSPAPVTSTAITSTTVSDKVLKRLRKNLSKLGEKSNSSSLPLSDWLAQAGKHKEKTIEVDEVIRGLKVSLVDGRWQLDV